MSIRRLENNVTISFHKARVSACVLAIAVLAALVQRAAAQRYTASANPESPEGQFLDLIGLQSDEAKKLALIEQFPQRFPRHPAASWAYEQLQLAAIQASQWDRALAFGERLAQLNPQRILESPPPKDPELLEEWKKETAVASQYSAQDEYTIYKKALESGDPRQQIKLLDELLKRNSDTAYLPQALVVYLNAYRALGDSGNGMLTAEKILKIDPKNEDALLTAAEGYLRRGSATEKVLAYSARLIEVMGAKKKPAIVRQEDWEKKKSFYAGTAHWMIGNIYINQNRFGQADSELRAALTMLRHSDQSAASILFYLGWSNYKLENYAEAVRFFKQCMAIQSQFQEQAQKNLDVIRSEQGIQ